MSIQTNNDLPDDRSCLPGSILEHVSRALGGGQDSSIER